jgi:hypothetical protein
VGIVVGWLAAMGWLFWHDLWPNWRPGEPPGFSIDLVEEVRKSDRDRLPTYWNVQRQKKGAASPRHIFRATTWVDYRQKDDTFVLHAELEAKGKEKDDLEFLGFKVKSMTSSYRVTRAGQLQELRSEVSFTLAGAKPAGHLEDVKTAPILLVLRGEARGGQFFLSCRGSFELLSQTIEMDLPPVPMSHNTSVLMPLHPVNRIHGLRPGQSWRQPLIDPIRDALGSGVHYLDARVLPQPQVLKEDDNDITTCLVIEYKDKDGQDAGRTWVEQNSERVQQQEAVLDGDRWIMKRDKLGRTNKRTSRFFPG